MNDAQCRADVKYDRAVYQIMAHTGHSDAGAGAGRGEAIQSGNAHDRDGF
jgi:hypothetical protein